MRAPDSLIIPALITGELGRRFARRVRSGPLFRWRFTGTMPTGFIIAPRDLRPTDPNRALEFYGGHYSFGQDHLSTGGESPFSASAPSNDWFAFLHGFSWLRHMRAADTALAQANAAALVADWIDIWGGELSSSSWRSDIVASRLISWFCHSPMLIKSATESDYRRLLRSCGRQVRYLQHNAPYIRDGHPRLRAVIALAYSAVCLAGREKTLKHVSRELDRELERQILPDGGHISRNPSTLLEILTDLLPLAQAYKTQGLSPSPVMLSAIDKIFGAIRFFRHSNGDLVQFNGTGFTDAPLLTTLLRYDPGKGAILSEAPHSGYQRLSAGNTTVLIDTGKPFSRSTARRAMAGTLSFELSSGSTRFITNCSVPDTEFKKYAPFTRATAAHSTVSLNDHSSSRFAPETSLYDLLPSPLIRAPQNVSSKRILDDNFITVVANHDGYLDKFGVVHERELQLSSDGSTLNGCDRFLRKTTRRMTDLNAAVRFHLPANISASPLSSGHSILIAGSDNEAWTFTCIDAPILLEESMQFAGPGQPRKSQQIAIYLDPDQLPSLRWTFELRTGKTAERKTRKKSKTNSTSPDLLDSLQDTMPKT